jgi:hypothetical protein
MRFGQFSVRYILTKFSKNQSIILEFGLDSREKNGDLITLPLFFEEQT